MTLGLIWIMNRHFAVAGGPQVVFRPACGPAFRSLPAAAVGRIEFVVASEVVMMLRLRHQHAHRVARLLHNQTAPRSHARFSRPSNSSNSTPSHRNLHLQQYVGLPAPQARPSGLRSSASGRRCLTPRGGSSRVPLQFRGLATGGKSEGKPQGDDGKAEADGTLERLKKMFQEVSDKDPNLKKSMEDLKEITKGWQGSDKKVQEAMEQIKKMQEEASKKATDASGTAQKAFQEKMEGVKKTLKENMEKVGGASAGGAREAKEGEEAENEFVRASKEKFSETQKALDENSYFAKIKAGVLGLRDTVAGASAEVFGRKDDKKESPVVKKLHKPKVKKPKKTPEQKAAESKDKGKDGKAAEASDDEGEEEEKEEEEKGGVSSLMIVKSAGEAWKKLQERLKEAPIIQELLGASRVVAKGSLGQGAKAAKDKVKDKVEDVQEAWETSQHPLVYKMSSAWDSMTAESEIAIGVRELRRLDSSFNLEQWKTEIQDDFLPEFMSAFFRGDAEELEQWTGEACFKKLSSEIKQRKADGVVLDPHVLDVRQGEVLVIKPDPGGSNYSVAFQFMCQQINCVRNKDGEVIEGSEDDIRATYYILSFQREFLENEYELRWKVTDIMVVGAFPWY